MLYCNLSGLMAAKKVNISEVSRCTGISRTTLTSLYYNSFKGIQLETLDTLCKFFDVTADKILVFSKYSVEITIDSNSEYIFVEDQPDNIYVFISFKVSIGEISKTVVTCGVLYLSWSSDSVSLELDLGYSDPVDSDEERDNEFLNKALSSLPYEVKALISKQIENEIISYYDSDFGEREVDISSYVELWD